MPAHQRPPEISWLLQIQYKPGEPWHDHTSNLFTLQAATDLKAERLTANPKLRYRLIRVTTTYTVETTPDRSSR